MKAKASACGLATRHSLETCCSFSPGAQLSCRGRGQLPPVTLSAPSPATSRTLLGEAGRLRGTAALTSFSLMEVTAGLRRTGNERSKESQAETKFLVNPNFPRGNRAGRGRPAAPAGSHGHAHGHLSQTSGPPTLEPTYCTEELLTGSKSKSSCSSVTAEMDKPGRDSDVDASLLCRLPEESTAAETAPGPQQPPLPVPGRPTPVLALHRSNKQVFSMLHIIQTDL